MKMVVLEKVPTCESQFLNNNIIFMLGLKCDYCLIYFFEF